MVPSGRISVSHLPDYLLAFTVTESLLLPEMLSPETVTVAVNFTVSPAFTVPAP